MNILGFNISRSRSNPAPAQKAASPAPINQWLRGEGLPAGPTLSNAYQQVVWVYRAINALAEQVANIPFRFSIGQSGGEHLITSGPLVDFYSRPHPHLDR